ncbi:MAG: flagellar biosynthesis anti-sigma factor FlgM [Thiobacillus sp.]|uniref:flagellar biosynthesis anti-sigma factor FlgM n=1 Tax=Thiobacillus sp. TaxID=924 RepID=UPI002733CF1A|nr:flagellar biosynthesis anti-sigma factor FlgM [Thiobacillus sp.]MDP3585441.1 flagellar biosynthesis anti-sigma factor FlgM [Thiobacillus sp.]
MKIDPGPKPTSTPATTGTRPAQPQENANANARTSAGAGAGQTDVNLSARVADMRKLEAQLAAIPVVDPARVESIKAAIANGEYTIKPENIAAGLIASVKEMLHVAR